MGKDICPECWQGKHQNCDGTSDMLDSGQFVPCGCNNIIHSNKE